MALDSHVCAHLDRLPVTVFLSTEAYTRAPRAKNDHSQILLQSLTERWRGGGDSKDSSSLDTVHRLLARDGR